MTKKILYISYDGMTDNLGQSQVIPYLDGLSQRGFKYWLISFEKSENYNKRKDTIKSLLAKAGITWIPLNYTSTPPVISTIKDINSLLKTAKQLHQKEQFDIVHCRSYISAFAGLMLKRKFGVKFVFDMRGFWPDERLDGKIWNKSNPIFSLVYSYFKRQEKKYFTEADYTISLTDAGKKEIHTWDKLQNQPIPIKVIPCCADFEHFKPSPIQNEQTQKLRTDLGINPEDFVLSYLGSVGTWYMLDEMLEFYKVLLTKKPHAKFLFITAEPENMILNAASKLDLDTRLFIIKSAPRELVPAYIELSSLSIFFIKPVFSKKASSPTKMAEIMGMGIPLICNDNVGDVGSIIKETNCGLAISEFNNDSYLDAINKIDDLTQIDKETIRNEALKRFALSIGVDRYAAVYTKCLS